MSENYWKEPLRWNTTAEQQGRRIQVFCASMADVFDPEAPAGQLDRLWNLIRATPSLDWQLLTKRPERIRESLPDDWGLGWPNVWLGTSVEDSQVIERIGHLVNVSAIVHFLSLEPLIGPIPDLPLSRIDWVIVGGESGPDARFMNPGWVRDIRRQCRTFGVAFFFKQWGGVRKREAGRKLDGRFYNEMPRPENKALQIQNEINARKDRQGTLFPRADL